MLTLAVLLLAALFGSAAAQTTSCVNAGYDLTSITGADLFFMGTGNTANTGTNYTWAIRPCGTVTTAGFCTGQSGEFCQGSTTISSMNVTGANVGNGAIWGQIQLNGQYGVAQFLQDGTSCGGVGDREGTIIYLCNPSATTPYISSIIEETTCHYQAVVQTSAVCAQVPSTGFSTSLGTTIISQQCGGGIYDLTSLNTQDINTNLNGFNWAIRPCGTVTSTTACNTTANVSVCQSGNVAAVYTPALIPTFYQYLQQNSVNQIIQDGAGCGNQARYTNISFVCNATATTPVLSSTAEAPTCHYYLTVQTAATCGTAFAGQPALTSSSGSVAPPTQSSTGAPAATSTRPAATSTPAAATSTPASPTAAPATSTPAGPTAAAATSVAVTPVASTAGGSPPNANPGNGASAAAASLSLVALAVCALSALVVA